MFSPAEDVSCERLSPWKPGCWGGPAGDKRHSQASLRLREAIPASTAGKTRCTQRGQPARQVDAGPRAEAEPPGQEIQNPTQHIRLGQQTRLGRERRNRTLESIVAETAVRSLGSQMRGCRHHVLKRVQAPEQGRHKVPPGPAGQVLPRGTQYMTVQLAQVSSSGPLR